MGGSQSATRKLSVDNENAIQVSQDALDRISSQLANKQAEQNSSQPVPNYYPPPPPNYYDTQKQQKDFAAEEAYWNRRIEVLKKAHEKISTGMKLEYQKTLKEANELFEETQKDKVISKLPPCEDLKAKIIQCYTDNPERTLACSGVVNEFNNCVCKSRVAAVTAAS